MNQTEAAKEVALALVSSGIFDNVRMVEVTEGDHPAVILTEMFDAHLSVTVEILDQS